MMEIPQCACSPNTPGPTATTRQSKTNRSLHVCASLCLCASTFVCAQKCASVRLGERRQGGGGGDDIKRNP